MISGCRVQQRRAQSGAGLVGLVVPISPAPPELWLQRCTQWVGDFHLQSDGENATDEVAPGRWSHGLVVPAVRDVESLRELWEIFIMDDLSERKPRKIRQVWL